jgi:hypothetical protein
VNIYVKTRKEKNSRYNYETKTFRYEVINRKNQGCIGSKKAQKPQRDCIFFKERKERNIMKKKKSKKKTCKGEYKRKCFQT